MHIYIYIHTHTYIYIVFVDVRASEWTENVGNSAKMTDAYINIARHVYTHTQRLGENP